MGSIEVRNVPDDLLEALRHRAAEDQMDLQDYVMRLIRRDLARPSHREWLDELHAQPVTEGTPAAAEDLRELRRERGGRR